MSINIIQSLFIKYTLRVILSKKSLFCKINGNIYAEVKKNEVYSERGHRTFGTKLD